ncbi:hypothetical protein BJY21_002026 [Kineosphaera limosa]|uniref:Uncharacterized protein n=1 Tax=Kineosphaera limosa NBRC 100340 TaxID=1184609 RepID=K6XDR4_9MICO|nr:DEAD/DEAH box helicase [Kineosphaera limosa]NYE00842.1 hypothetical protein [Kineosphaera limosa]GAB96969.1 hypothetical protein KILIM_053_00200 [Kineosphaera limosa NBRC 100340]
MSQGQSQARVIRAWRDMELFSPQTVKKANPGDGTAPSVDWRPGMPLPWEEGTYLQRRPLPPRHVWRHTVYVWIYDLTTMYDCLDHIYAAADAVYDERPLGQSAAACFAVDEHGHLDPESAVLSSAAWGLGRALRADRRSDRWFDEFTQATADYAQTISELVGLEATDPSERGRALTPELLMKIGGLTRAATGLPRKHTFRPIPGEIDGPGERDPLPVATIARIQSRAVDPDKDDDSSDFLNSFILDDLGRAADAVEAGNASPALMDYLAGAVGCEAAQRTDTVARPGLTYPEVRPAVLPYGRWPSKPAHSLATSQQLAVDLSLGDLDGGPALRSVNGPPGTGKTTLLRDVFAGLVVERARRLADLEHPRAAFTGEKRRWKVGEFIKVVHVLRPELTGFEMVVASSNNRAVENVSDELPGSDAVKEPWAEADYLRDIATLVRRATKGDESAQAWGMVAARLGNRTNRRAFANAFWTNKREWQGEPRTFRHLLEEAAAGPSTSWADAVGAFRRALGRVDKLAAEATQAEQRLVRNSDVHRELQEMESHLARLTREEPEAAQRQQEIARELFFATTKHDEADARVAEHLRSRPGWWAALTSLGAAHREWDDAGAPLRVAAEAAAAAHTRTESALTAARERVTGLRRDIAQAQEQRTSHLKEQRELAAVCESDRQRWGAAYPDAHWLESDRARELNAPWADESLNRARTEAFLAGLRIHHVWFEHCATGEPGQPSLVQSMRAAMDVVRGGVPKDVDPAAVLAAWQTFFLVVPLVSTTFASFGRMFSHLGAESLGWVFVDEAGQATPQSAVGALWRAQHALVVGDPFQLTPIVTLPAKAEANIATEHGASQEALPSRTSVQVVADRINPWGTSLGSGDARIWVGTPLRVHRRCDDPMFTISNTVAYGGLMIHGKPAAELGADPASRTTPDEVERDLPESCWLHVKASNGDGHALRTDIEVAKRLVRDLLDGTTPTGAPPVPAKEIFVISPFRAMANAVARFPDLLGHPVGAGTVHTAQGQEADVVVFVLGGDPTRPGARTWAASTPNLVNVAASRAKTRLYVIGDHHAWAGLPHFTTLDSHLPWRAVSPAAVW